MITPLSGILAPLVILGSVLPRPVMVFDASAITGLAHNAALTSTSWVDGVSGSRVLVPTRGTPRYIANRQNGLPAVRLPDGAALTSSSDWGWRDLVPTATSGHSWYAVYIPVAGGHAGYRALWHTRGVYFDVSPGTTAASVYAYGGSNNLGTVTSSLDALGTAVIAVALTGPQSSGLQNGQLYNGNTLLTNYGVNGPHAGYTYATAGTGQVQLGYPLNGGGTWAGDLCELRVYVGKHDAAVRSRIVAQLGAKWGVTT